MSEISVEDLNNQTWLNTKLSDNTTVDRYLKLLAEVDKKNLGVFIVERFEERFFRPLEAISKHQKNGFAMMAIACLIVETLESFHQGLEDTNGCSNKMFKDFFNREVMFNPFKSEDSWFFKKIRCGILHQAETRDGWKIRRKGELLNYEEKCINANEFIKELRNSVNTYSSKLINDEELWTNFKIKMDSICKNCKPNN